MTTDAKTETVLLPCPWCHQPPQTVGIFVVCKNESCPSSQLIEKSKWNRRATPAGPDQIALMRNEILIYTREIERLRAALQRISRLSQLTGATFEWQSFEATEMARQALEETK